VTAISLDYETFSEVDLKAAGLDRYAREARVLLCAYAFDGGRPKLWQEGDPFPREVREALLDPAVEKWSFNAQFERTITMRALRIPTPIEGWRCTQALAYMQSFSGGLEEVGAQMGIPADKLKSKEGKRLIRMFCMPQRITKKQPHRIRDRDTDPLEWELFGDYCIQDVVAETEIKRRLIQFPVLDEEWRLYELDQLINDRGMPVDLDFVGNAMAMAKRRTDELVRRMAELTGIANPNSTSQLLPWLRERGYPFEDLQKATVQKVLTENAEAPKRFLTADCVRVLKLRQWAARISTRKATAVAKSVGPDGMMRYIFQFAGASRTNRWAGRRVQPQNLPRTPKILEAPKGEPPESVLGWATDCIRFGDYDGLHLLSREPMEILVGCTRSMFRAPDGWELGVCDLSAIESRVIAWLSRCERLIKVFEDGLDPYKDFGTFLYGCAYEEVTKEQRTNSKPAVLGAGYRLSGGELKDGKKTGLWGYAESMGIMLPREECHRAVRIFRNESYPEIPQLWYDLEAAASRALRRKTPTDVGGCVFEYIKPYLTVLLPSGRRMYYYKPRFVEKTFTSQSTGEEFTRILLTHMGQEQKTGVWMRLPTHGGKLCENLVQAIARDVLADAMRRAHEAGFHLIGHVHDELIWLRRRGSNEHTLAQMREIMAAPIPWLPGIPLDAAGYCAEFYRKD